MDKLHGRWCFQKSLIRYVTWYQKHYKSLFVCIVILLKIVSNEKTKFLIIIKKKLIIREL